MERIPIIKGRRGVSLTEEHKRHISEAKQKNLSKPLQKKYGTTNYDEAFEKFFLEGKAAINAIAEKYKKYAPKEELIQETALKLYEDKFKTYDPRRSNINTFVGMVARQTMHMYCKPETLNKSEYNELSRIRLLKNSYAQKTGKNLTVEEIAKQMKTTPDRVNYILEGGEHMLSLESKNFEDSELLLGDVLSTEDKSVPTFLSPEDIMIKSQLKIILDQGINSLKENEKKILLLCTGYEDGITRSDHDISEILGMTAANVGVSRKKAFKHIKEYLKGFEDMDIEKSKADKTDIIELAIKYLNSLEKSLENQNTKDEIKGIIKSLSSKIEEKKVTLTKSQKYENIRIRQRNPQFYKKDSLRTISLSKSLGIKAVIGNLPNDSKLSIQTLIFNRDPKIGKVWNLKESKEWVRFNKSKIKLKIDINELFKSIKESKNLKI